jgi:hypothetical protein
VLEPSTFVSSAQAGGWSARWTPALPGFTPVLAPASGPPSRTSANFTPAPVWLSSANRPSEAVASAPGMRGRKLAPVCDTFSSPSISLSNSAKSRLSAMKGKKRA